MNFDQLQVTEFNILNEDTFNAEIKGDIVWLYHDFLLTIGYYFAKQLQKQRRQEYAEATLKCLFGIKEA